MILYGLLDTQLKLASTNANAGNLQRHSLSLSGYASHASLHVHIYEIPPEVLEVKFSHPSFFFFSNCLPINVPISRLFGAFPSRICVL